MPYVYRSLHQYEGPRVRRRVSSHCIYEGRSSCSSIPTVHRLRGVRAGCRATAIFPEEDVPAHLQPCRSAGLFKTTLRQETAKIRWVGALGRAARAVPNGARRSRGSWIAFGDAALDAFGASRRACLGMPSALQALSSRAMTDARAVLSLAGAFRNRGFDFRYSDAASQPTLRSHGAVVRSRVQDVGVQPSRVGGPRRRGHEICIAGVRSQRRAAVEVGCGGLFTSHLYDEDRGRAYTADQSIAMLDARAAKRRQGRCRRTSCCCVRTVQSSTAGIRNDGAVDARGARARAARTISARSLLRTPVPARSDSRRCLPAVSRSFGLDAPSRGGWRRRHCGRVGSPRTSHPTGIRRATKPANCAS